MSATISTRQNGITSKLFSSSDPITDISPTSSNGRAKVSIRISSEGNKIGFGGTALSSAWVTVEVSEELPHKNAGNAQTAAFEACRSACTTELNKSLEILLASLMLEEEDKKLLDELLENAEEYAAAGVPEVFLRALHASPVKTFQVLTDEEKRELRGCRK